MIKQLRLEKGILIIACTGLALRILFILIGAHVYFDRSNIFVSGDTAAWATCFQNLYKFGTYTVSQSNEFGYFGRMPGYSFFMGIIYLLSGHDWETVYPIVGWLQTLLDFFGIILIYKIGERLFVDKRTATILAILYATYPFIIVWTPVAYSEYLSIFILLAGIYCFLCEEKKHSYAVSGLLIGLAVLFRPQIMVFMPLLIGSILVKERTRAAFKKTRVFIIFFLLSYSPWPLRNYINHQKLVLTQDIRGFANWNTDVVSFMQYVYSVKGEWEPQFSSIIRNGKVSWPKEAYLTEGDSIKLNRAVFLSQNCGSGFSEWEGYWKEKFSKPNCNSEIKKLFDEMRLEQMENNSFHFWVTIPFKNLKKAIFKTTLYSQSTTARKVASLLFFYRTFLIILGLAGCYFLYRSEHRNKGWAIVILINFLLVYISICAGTSVQLRNIEIRYFLQADILLLIPAAYVIPKLFDWFLRRKHGKKA